MYLLQNLLDNTFLNIQIIFSYFLLTIIFLHFLISVDISGRQEIYFWDLFNLRLVGLFLKCING